MFRHAALSLTGEDLLLALVSERIDRLLDRMILVGHSRLGILGRRAHTRWMMQWVSGMRQLPVKTLITCAELDELEGDDHDPESTGPHGLPVIDLRDPNLHHAADSILISDDLFESALYDLAKDTARPGTVVHRLYDRLPTARESLPRLAPTVHVRRQVLPAVAAQH